MYPYSLKDDSWFSKPFEMVQDPSKFAVAAAPPDAADAEAEKPAAAPVEDKEEPAEESDDDMGFGLFD